MVDISELTESVKGYIEGLQDVLQRKYQISEEKALNMITSSYIMDSLIDYPEETLHDDNGELQYEDGYNDVFRDGALSTVFVDGKACNKETFEDIRERLNGGNKDE